MLDPHQKVQHIVVNLIHGYVVLNPLLYQKLDTHDRQAVSLAKRIVKWANFKAEAGCQRLLLVIDSLGRIRTAVCIRPAQCN